MDRLWKFESHLDDSKYDKIKKFINGDIDLDELADNDCSIWSVMERIIYKCLTCIRMLLPNGFEFWYIANFEKGLKQSKWFRAESTALNKDISLAELNVMGLKNSTISKLYYDHSITRNSTKIKWFDFASQLMQLNIFGVDYRQRCGK